MAEETVEYKISLIVEDGSCVDSANSYVSLAYADTYAKNRNYDTWLNAASYIRSAAIMKAMDYVDNIFEWKGRRKYRDQPLKFPRVQIFDDERFCYDGIIPEQLKKAVCEAAFYVLEQYTLFVNSGDDATGNDGVKRYKADTTELEYQSVSKDSYMTIKDLLGDNGNIDYTSKYQALDTILRGLFWPKGISHSWHRVRWE